MSKGLTLPVNSFGAQGSEGRCYKLFLNYSVCVDKADNPREECKLLREDYFECLHHRKEFDRRIAINRRLRELGGKIPEAGAEQHKENDHHGHH